MAERDLYLTIDQGGHASRALVFDAGGEVVAQAFAKIATQHPAPDRVEHDPQEMVQSIRDALCEIADRLGDRCQQIRAAGLATQRSSICCWDHSSGEALSPIISWQDRRANHWLTQFQDREESVHALTGLRLSPHYGVSKLHWCLEHLPAVTKAQRAGHLTFGPLASFLLFQLLKERPLLADPANASRTLLWNFQTLDWSSELLDLFSIPADPLPQCVPSRSTFGTLPLGEHEIPLTITTGDQSAALFAYGTPQSDSLYINMGTGAFVQRPCGGTPPDPGRLLASVVYQEEQGPLYVMEGTVNGAGSALDWAQHELNIEAQAMPGMLEEGLEQATEPPLFLNGISGLGSPFWVADFSSRFIGEGDTQAKLVAVAESILFLLQTNIEQLQASSSQKLEHILISGGLASQDGLCQRLADLTSLTVQRTDITEATALGLAFLLADQPAIWNKEQRVKSFQPKAHPGLTHRYEQWRLAMKDALAEKH
jgi:glycerol kinase